MIESRLDFKNKVWLDGFLWGFVIGALIIFAILL